MIKRRPAPASPEPTEPTLSVGAIEWALHKVDKSLDEMEANPNGIQRAIYQISRGPVGTATVSAVEAATKVTLKATGEVAKAAAPVAKRMLAEGMRAMGGLVTKVVVDNMVKSAGGGEPGSGGSGTTKLRSTEERRKGK